MMKWWGWGANEFLYPMDERPQLWPWIKKTLGITAERISKPVARKDVILPKAVVNAEFSRAIEKVLMPAQIKTDDDERLLHAYGKSYPDLLRVRRGQIDRAPDMVVLPSCHDDVEAVIREAHKHNVCVIPFGGGTNIVGGVNPVERSERMVVSLDLREMTRLLAIDEQSMTATMEGGALGPKMEEQLQQRGYSLGHHPDSFQFSTLGGWLATRSAGMQSDAYGKIEDMVVALRMVTPTGTLMTKPVPKAATGPDMNQIAVGSEGVLGVITEATMRVHPNPPVKSVHGWLFRTYEDGFAAMRECVSSGNGPSMFRLSDMAETELSFQMKRPSHGFEAVVTRLFKKYLLSRGYATPCLMLTGFEGTSERVNAVRPGAFRILKRCGGVHLGTKVGESWSKEKYNMPYLRDFIMDYSCMVDVAETATTWGNLLPLYNSARNAMLERFKAENTQGYIGCHISHTYKTGASLYFTYAALQTPGKEMEQYYGYKRLITETFVKNGGALSHHHAVGYEHLDWMEREVSTTGIRALHGLKKSLDPQGIMNPGKLIPGVQKTES